MRSRVHQFSALFLSVALALHGLAAGASRSHVAETMVICSGAEVIVITLDSGGTPVPEHHHCPECIQWQGALVGLTAPLLAPNDLGPAAPDRRKASVFTPQFEPHGPSRGPPVLI